MKYWLMKAEPNSRIEKGKDVKFSIDDFESVKTTPWEGVRNHEAKKLMQSMKVGDQVLFYHSNCKNSGVAGFAEIAKEAYPDYTAWDPEHPYYDPKSVKDNPKWFMVDVTFKSRAAHHVPLSLFKWIANSHTDDPPTDVAYIGSEGVRAIKEMALIKRGRLSVQPVEEDAWKAVQLLAVKGGWEEDLETMTSSGIGAKRKKGTKMGKGIADDIEAPNEKKQSASSRGRRKTTSKAGEVDGVERNEDEEGKVNARQSRPQKRKAEDRTKDEEEVSAPRRLTRSRR
ncbi:PSY2_1 [Sanghuangporus sanghuang]